MRTAAQIEANSEIQSDQRQKQRKPNAGHENVVPFKWKPGQSGNPGGRPKKDVASDICQQVFEAHPELIGQGLLNQLRKGNGFVFKEAADRAYGKVADNMNVHVSLSLADRLEKARKRKQAKSVTDK